MAERPEDLNLPNAVITRIIKEAIPDGVNISKEARLAISKAASVFVLYATSCSNNFAMKSKRKTIHAQDVLSAMQDMEFEQFLEPLKTCLDSFRHDQQGKKEACERRKKAKEEIVVCIDDEDEKENDDNHEDELMDGDDNSRDDDYIENNEVEEEEEEEEEEEDDEESS